MLRTGVYCLWKASECATLEISGLGQAALRCLPLLDGKLVTSGHARSYSAAAGEEEERVITNPKVLDLAEQITQLNLLEVSDLTEILRKRLNIQAHAGGMGFAFPPGGMPVAGAPAAGKYHLYQRAPAAAEAAAPVEEKTDFNIKLDGFDAASKIKVIKEVRAITDLGLKEAKELVESAPAVLRKGVKKEEADQIKAKLEAAGAKIALE